MEKEMEEVVDLCMMEKESKELKKIVLLRKKAIEEILEENFGWERPWLANFTTSLTY